MTCLLHISSVLLLVAFSALPENTLGLSLVPVSSSSPASVDSSFSHQNDYGVKYSKDKKFQFLNQKFEKTTEQPATVPESFVSNQDETRQIEQQQQQQLKPQVLPAVIPGGPDQPSSDILPPLENEEVDQEFFVNVKSKPVEKTKRDSSDLNAGAQEMPQGRFLSIPGLINWGGEGGSSSKVRLECPEKSPVAPDRLNCDLKECDDDSNCFGERKCCRYACALICVDPVKELNHDTKYTGHDDDDDAKDVHGNLLDFINFIPSLINTHQVGQNNNNNNYQKPGSCYRPSNNNYYTGPGYNNGYYGNNYGRVKRQTTFGNSYTPYNTNNGFGGGYPVASSNNGGWQGGNYIPPGNNNGGWQGGNGGGESYCYRDNDCPGNKKCCSRVCRTPAFVG